MRNTVKVKKARVKLATRVAGQRLEYPPSGPKYTLPSKIGKVSVK